MISLNAILSRIESFAENHYFIQTFSFGKSADELDLEKLGTYPALYLVYNGADYDEGTKTYNFELYLIDLPGEKEEKNEQRKEAVSDSEQCLEDLLADISSGGNIFIFDEDYEVTSGSVLPIYASYANVLAGALLDISISVPYDRSACNLPLNGVQPEGGGFTYARRGLLRMLTINGATDVLSVNTIRVPNGTLTDNGNGDVTLSISGGAGGVSSVNDIEPDINGNIALDTDDIPEGETNEYYTDARVDARVTALGLATTTYVDTEVGNEESARISADSGLQTQINTATGSIVANAADIATNAADIAALEAANYVNTLNGLSGAVTLSAGSNVTLTQVGNDIEISSSGGGGGGHSFGTIAVPGQSNIVADSGNDTLNINAGTGIDLATNATTDTLTIAVDATTTDIPEGSNLYHTNARVNTLIAAASVTDLTDVTSAGSGAIITSAERTKLAGIETGAEVNPTASEIKTAYESNADTNAFTDAEKSKLAGIAAGAEVNVNADWNSITGDSQILNKPTLAAVATSGAYSDLSGTPTIPSASYPTTSVTGSTALTPAYEQKFVIASSSSAITLEIQTGLTKDAEILVYQGGTGSVTITGASGVTIRNTSGFSNVTAEQYAVIGLKQVGGADEWVITGERKP